MATMKSEPIYITLGSRTAAGLGVLTDPYTGKARSVDLRLHRLDDYDQYSSTPAGLRIPLQALRPLAAALTTLADQLGAK